MPSFQTIFFIIALICAAPVIYWYYRRNPHPRFRPRFGEMAMVTLFAVLLSLGGSMLIGGLMDDPEQLKGQGGFSTMPSTPTASGSGQNEEESDREGSSRKQDSGDRGRGGESGGGERR
jgi:hypothetical protein